MIVKNFMLPRSEVKIIEPDALLCEALDTMVGTPECCAMVVTTGPVHLPIGVITKTDLMKAYKDGLDPKVHKAREAMSTSIETVFDTATRDAVAKHFADTKHKTAFVVNKENHFVGLVSALDVAIEVSRDDHAFPWNRDSLEKMYQISTSPRSPKWSNPPRVHTEHSPPVEKEHSPPVEKEHHTFEQIGGEFD
jgi:CBS domain-containing protein